MGTGTWWGWDKAVPTHTFTSGAGKPSRAGLTTSSSLAFLASWARGTLDASRALGKKVKG